MQPVYYNYNIVLIDLGKISNKNYFSFLFYWNKTIYNVLLRINHVTNTLIRKIIKASFYSVKRFFLRWDPTIRDNSGNNDRFSYRCFPIAESWMGVPVHGYTDWLCCDSHHALHVLGESHRQWNDSRSSLWHIPGIDHVVIGCSY